MEQVKKPRKKLWLLVAVICVLVVAAGAGIALLSGGVFSSSPKGEKCTLYWNIDGKEYLNSAGLSSRKPEADGTYRILFAVDGKQVEYRVTDKALVDDIDNREVMGLKVNKKGTITGVLDPEEVCDGEMISKWFVVSEDDSQYKVAQTEGDTEGLNYMVKVSEHTGIYDVTGGEPIGQSTALKVGDCVRVFRNFDKEVIYVFIVKPEGKFDGNTVTKYCAHCDEEVKWNEWTETSLAPSTAGHWCLMNDITLSYQCTLSGREDVVIDLNGKSLSAIAKRRVFSVGTTAVPGSLILLDQSKEETGLVKGSGYTRNGGVIYVASGKVELYSGTIDASEVYTEYYGAAVHMVQNTIFNMYGGTIIGGTSKCNTLVGGVSYTGGSAGSVNLLSGSVFTMYDGVIRDGKALAYVNDETKTWGVAGNVSLRSGATFIMEGGEILNGTAERLGGNVFIATSGAKFVMKNGVISGGKCTLSGGNGGNVYVQAGSSFELQGGSIKNGIVMEGNGGNVSVYGTFLMTGGKVSGGSSVTGTTLANAKRRENVKNHNIYCTATGILEMSGGVIDGYVSVNHKDCIVKLSGTAQITGGENNLHLASGVRIRLGYLTKGAKIGLTGAGYVSDETASKNLSYFYSDYEEVKVTYRDKKFFIGKMACICGGCKEDESGKIVTVAEHYGACNGKVLEWWPWTDPAFTPTVAGNWYLLTDLELSTQRGFEKGITISLDLNGHTINGKEDTRVFILPKDAKVHLNLTDLSEKKDGKIVSTGKTGMIGSCMLVMHTNKVVMYGGSLDASKFVSTMSGVALTVRPDANFVMYGGTIIGGKAENCSAGSLLLEGEFTLCDGVIRDGVADVRGGNVFVNGGKLRVLGGEIANGVGGEGGNIRMTAESTLLVKDGIISNGSAVDGGNVYIPVDASLSMQGGTITGGTAENRGGNIYTRGDIVVSGGIVSNGVVSYEDPEDDEKAKKEISTGKGVGGNIYARGLDDGTRIKFEISGGTFEGGIAKEQGANIFINGNVNFTLGTDKVVSEDKMAVVFGGKDAINGGNVFARLSNTLTIKASGVIKDGVASGNGGNVYVKDSNFILDGGSIHGGTGVLGGAVYIDTTATIDVKSGIVSGGTATKRGGNIYTQGNLTMSGGIISNGTAFYAGGGSWKDGIGGNICFEGVGNEPISGLITGGTITGGYANGRGANICLFDKVNFVLGKDEAEENNFAVISDNRDMEGALVPNGGNIFARGASSIDIKASGRIQNGRATGNGGNISYAAPSTSSFVLNGGMLSGGLAKVGGSVYISENSVMTMNSGSLVDGKAEQGGNVYIEASGNLTGHLVMTGGTISGGEATLSNGGNIRMADKARFTMKNGTVSNGKATQAGGNVYGGKVSVIDIQDGTITGGNAKTCGGNVYTKGNVTMTGGIMSGGTVLCNGNLSNAAGVGGNLYAMGDGSNIAITITKGRIENGTAKANAGNTPGRGGNVFLILNVTFTLGDDAAKAEGQAVITGGKDAVDGGNLYARNVPSITVKKGGLIENGSATNGGNVYLNGTSALTMAEGSINSGTAEYGGNIYVESSASMTMSGGSITGGEAGIQGGNIYTQDDITMSGGTISGGTAKYSGTPTYQYGVGGNIFASGVDSTNTAEVAITGGTVTGGYANGRGGNVYLFSNANLTLGKENATEEDLATISNNGKDGDNLVPVGGNIFARGGCSVTIKAGGTVSGGNAKSMGGNINFTSGGAKLTISGGKVANGTLSNGNGGNIYIDGGTLEVVSGTISGGSANNGGSIYMSSVMKMADGTITGGTAVTSGGNVYVVADKTMTVNGGTIEKGTAAGGGNIYLATGGKYVMNGGTISDGTAGSGLGGNILGDGATTTLTVNAGSILNGQSGGTGGNIQLKHSSLILGTGKITITGGKRTSDNKAFPLCVYGNATNKITLPTTMHTDSKIDIWVSSAGVFATNATEELQKYQTIFIPAAWANKTISIDTAAKQLKW